MKRLLIVSAMIELGAGAALLCCPSVVAEFLLGSPLDGAVSMTLGRVAGTALLALGVANWLARSDEQSRAARGVVSAMVVYNCGAVILLSAAGVQHRPAGTLLWPAVVLHAVLAGWCIQSLVRTPAIEGASAR